jgi:hypothetical protein
MTHSIRARRLATATSDSKVGVGRVLPSIPITHLQVQAGSPPPLSRAVVGIAAPPVARA